MENIIVLFEVTLKPGKMEDYLSQAAALKIFPSVAKEENLSDRIRMSQKHGRAEDFEDYKITVVSPVRSYTMENREEAPADSNSFWEGN